MRADELLKRETVFKGKLIETRVDTVRLPNGKTREREVVHHPGAVAILPVLPSGEVVLVHQYRHAVERALLEVPAGTRELDESPVDCAHRELTEETGYSAGSLRELTRFYVSPGWADEELIAYVATELTAGSARPEDDEDLELVRIKPDEAPGLIASGEIADSKTIISLLGYFGLRLGAE